MEVFSALTAVLGHPTVNTVVLAAAVYFIRDLAKAVKELGGEVEKMKLHVATDYATKSDLKDELRRHETVFHEV
jgi:hypothetical protein